MSIGANTSEEVIDQLKSQIEGEHKMLTKALGSPNDFLEQISALKYSLERARMLQASAEGQAEHFIARCLQLDGEVETLRRQLTVRTDEVYRLVLDNHAMFDAQVRLTQELAGARQNVLRKFWNWFVQIPH